MYLLQQRRQLRLRLRIIAKKHENTNTKKRVLNGSCKDFIQSGFNFQLKRDFPVFDPLTLNSPTGLVTLPNL